MISTAPPPAAPAAPPASATPILPAVDRHAADHLDPLSAHRTRRNR